MKKLAIYFALAAVVGACSGEDPAREVSSKTKQLAEDSNSGQSGQRLEEQTDEHSETRYAVAEPFGSERKEALPRDDEATEQRDEAAADEYDEYDYVDEESTSTVIIKPRSEGYVEWQTPSELAYSTAEIEIITPDGKRIKRNFSSNEAMMLNEDLPDGLYKWESVITPEIDPEVREQMSRVRQSGDQQAEQQLLEQFRAEGSLPTEEESTENRQAGAFTVRDGVAMPTSIEDVGDE